jgi:cation-transporting ATPase 13A1
MSVAPYPIQCFRDNKWVTIQTDDLLPGDIVSIGKLLSFFKSNYPHSPSLLKVHTTNETPIPGDLLLLRGTCIVNEAMLSGESTPLLKESIELREGTEILDIDVMHKNNVLFSGTKAVQTSPGSGAGLSAPDNGCLAVVLRTGFGTSQGQLVRTMIFSTERVTANNFESFLFIGFLLIFAIAASWYVWVGGARLFSPRSFSEGY